MTVERAFEALIERDVRFGYLDRTVPGVHQLHPRVVVNRADTSMLRVLRDELRHCESFAFSVAFVSPRAIALLKQEFVESRAKGLIVTSDYLGFNSPNAFAELLNLSRLGIDVRIHESRAYHPKGYVFGHPDRIAAVLGSSNLTESALVTNHEWNLQVAATKNSDLARQFAALIDAEVGSSRPLTQEWLDEYSQRYVPPQRPEWQPARPPAMEDRQPSVLESGWIEALSDGRSVPAPTHILLGPGTPRFEPRSPRQAEVLPNRMQIEALAELAALRAQGEKKGLVISATGTGKTILAALDVRAADPQRVLFVAHREQILDKAMQEFQRVLGAHPDELGKLGGGRNQSDRRFVFATIQTLAQPDVLSSLAPDAFDYVLIDEVHHVGADSYLKVVDHFEPEFMLGITATPERTDGFNVFELFEFNVPYEIRLGRALEDDMLAPFHYYGVADVSFDDGSAATVDVGLDKLASRVRVDHIVRALETYAQAGVEPRGLMFCSRKEEARALSHQLNEATFRGRHLRTIALTGEDPVEFREASVERLERGELDYILTVDVFNEGVDIPSVNQVVMLRQTQSSIVFVQQLGRGLRKHPGKEYIVVIDFIGNYANNYLIPIALFGDDSLNKESLRQSLISAEESGVLPGLSSVRFDRISQQRVLEAIAQAKLDSLHNLKQSIEILRNRLGRLPNLHDYLRFESVDPVLLANRLGNYPALLERLFKVDSVLSPMDKDALTLLSSEALDAKRVHELLLVQAMLDGSELDVVTAGKIIARSGANGDHRHVASALRSLTLEFHTEGERKRFARPIVESAGNRWRLTDRFVESYRSNAAFTHAVDDLIATGLDVIRSRYNVSEPFTPGRQYTRKDACRLLCWEKNVASTIYGYKVDLPTSSCPIFVTLHKSDEISASTAYEDELLDRYSMTWFTRSRRTLASGEVRAIVNKSATPFVFAKKSDAEGADFYFLGRAEPHEARETTMPGDDGKPLSVVTMRLDFDQPIETAVFDYFHPVVTE